MNCTNAIQKRLAFFLLVIFTVSIVPKTFFHDALVRHTDRPVCVEKENGSVHLHQPTFHCLQDDVVLTGPFLLVLLDVAAVLQPFSCKRLPLFSSTLYASSFLHTENRGPPAVS